MRFLLALLAFLPFFCAHRPVHADWFYRFIGFECDVQNDRLVVHYKGAYNEAGKALRKSSERNEWEPDSLVDWDGDTLKRTRTVERSCKLAHATYRLRLGPNPGNANLQRRCGAVVSAWVEIWRGERHILPDVDGDGLMDAMYFDCPGSGSISKPDVCKAEIRFGGAGDCS
jgi:hypothetical protein